ncbi:MAG: hypothetical protein J7578_23830 [Chitinophagaceae bacterium]|nr:hypothetical protein [Chitinophagaceae bacterium]
MKLIFLCSTLVLLSIDALAQRTPPDPVPSAISDTIKLLPPHSKDVGLIVSYPYLNSFAYRNFLNGEAASRTGFVGIGGGLYFRKNDRKLSLNIFYVLSSPFPMGPIDYGKTGIRYDIRNWGMDAMIHYPVNSWLRVVGGINKMNLNYNLISYDSTIQSIDRTDASFGLTTGIELKFFIKELNLGLFYRPAIISSGEKFYRHVISLDARFDIPVWHRPKVKKVRILPVNKRRIAPTRKSLFGIYPPRN